MMDWTIQNIFRCYAHWSHVAPDALTWILQYLTGEQFRLLRNIHISTLERLFWELMADVRHARLYTLPSKALDLTCVHRMLYSLSAYTIAAKVAVSKLKLNLIKILALRWSCTLFEVRCVLMPMFCLIYSAHWTWIGITNLDILCRWCMPAMEYHQSKDPSFRLYCFESKFPKYGEVDQKVRGRSWEVLTS